MLVQRNLKGATLQLSHRFVTTALSLGLLAGNAFSAGDGGDAGYGAATAGSHDGVPGKMTGGMRTNPDGMTLYTFDKAFDKDPAGKSVCNGDCAKRWPPRLAGDSARGDYSVIACDDGSRQWAYKGKPLDLWIDDRKPGDTTGDGVNNVWHVARP